MEYSDESTNSTEYVDNIPEYWKKAIVQMNRREKKGLPLMPIVADIYNAWEYYPERAVYYIVFTEKSHSGVLKKIQRLDTSVFEYLSAEPLLKPRYKPKDQEDRKGHTRTLAQRRLLPWRLHKPLLPIWQF